MKKQILLGTVLIASISYATLPAFAQTEEVRGTIRPRDERGENRGDNRGENRGGRDEGRPRDERPTRPPNEDRNRPERPGRPDDGRPTRPGRPDDGRPDRPGRPDDGRPDRPGRPDDGRPDRPGRPDDGRPDRPGRPDDGRPDRPGRPDDGRPGHGRPGHGRPDRPGWPTPGRPGPGPGRPLPPPTDRYYEDTVQISSVTRASGGEWFRLNLRRPVTLESLQIRALSAGVRIHEARVYTTMGRTSYIAEMTPSRTFYAGDWIGASYFSYERVQSIDIRAESMGGYADLVIRVISNDDYPVMDVSRF